MNRPDMARASADYLGRVEQLLGDIDADERRSLLADLGEQLEELPDGELVERLGTPEAFASEYRRSAGLEHTSDVVTRSPLEWVAVVVSVLALPFGILILFSFGGRSSSVHLP